MNHKKGRAMQSSDSSNRILLSAHARPVRLALLWRLPNIVRFEEPYILFPDLAKRDVLLKLIFSGVFVVLAVVVILSPLLSGRWEWPPAIKLLLFDVFAGCVFLWLFKPANFQRKWANIRVKLSSVEQSIKWSIFESFLLITLLLLLFRFQAMVRGMVAVAFALGPPLVAVFIAVFTEMARDHVVSHDHEEADER